MLSFRSIPYDIVIHQWLLLLDTLNHRSNLLPSMATYYFSQTQNPNDVHYMTNYLYVHASKDIEHKWWWLLQCIYLAMYKLNNMDLALKVAKRAYVLETGKLVMEGDADQIRNSPAIQNAYLGGG